MDQNFRLMFKIQSPLLTYNLKTELQVAIIFTVTVMCVTSCQMIRIISIYSLLEVEPRTYRITCQLTRTCHVKDLRSLLLLRLSVRPPVHPSQGTVVQVSVKLPGLSMTEIVEVNFAWCQFFTLSGTCLAI